MFYNKHKNIKNNIMTEHYNQSKESDILGDATVEEPEENIELSDKKREALVAMKAFVEHEFGGEEAGKIMEKIEISLDNITEKNLYKLDFLLEDLKEIRNLRSSIGKVEKEINDFRCEYGEKGFEDRKAKLMLVRENSGLRGLLFRNLFRKRTVEEQEAKRALEEDYNIKVKDISSELKIMEQEMRIFSDAQQQKTELEKKLFSLKESLFKNFDALVDLTKRMRTTSYLETMRTMRESRLKPTAEKVEEGEKSQAPVLPVAETRTSPRPTKEETRDFFARQNAAQDEIHFGSDLEPSKEQEDGTKNYQVKESAETSSQELNPQTEIIKNKFGGVLNEFFTGRVDLSVAKNRIMTILIRSHLAQPEKEGIKKFVEEQVKNAVASDLLRDDFARQAQYLLDFFKEKLRQYNAISKQTKR